MCAHCINSVDIYSENYWSVIACSMYQQSQHTLDLPKLTFFCIPVFGGKVSLIFPMIDLIVDLKLICINDFSDLVNSLVFAGSCPR